MAVGFSIRNHNGKELFSATSSRTSMLLMDAFSVTGGINGSKTYDVASYGDVSGSKITYLSGYNSKTHKVSFSGNTLNWIASDNDDSEVEKYLEATECIIWVFKL
jgi:hypothetical protein